MPQTVGGWRKGHLECCLSSEKVSRLTKRKQKAYAFLIFLLRKPFFLSFICNKLMPYEYMLLQQCYCLLNFAVIIKRNAGSEETNFFPITYFQVGMSCYLTACQKRSKVLNTSLPSPPSFLQSRRPPEGVRISTILTLTIQSSQIMRQEGSRGDFNIEDVCLGKGWIEIGRIHVLPLIARVAVTLLCLKKLLTGLTCADTVFLSQGRNPRANFAPKTTHQCPSLKCIHTPLMTKGRSAIIRLPLSVTSNIIRQLGQALFSLTGPLEGER